MAEPAGSRLVSAGNADEPEARHVTITGISRHLTEKVAGSNELAAAMLLTERRLLP